MGDRLGELEALVLITLARCGGATRDGATGTALYQDLEVRAAAAPSVAAVHVTLKRLEVKGFVRSAKGVPSTRGGRAQRHYRLTPAGAEALRDAERLWRDVWKGVSLPDPETLA